MEPIALSIKDTGVALGGQERPLSRTTIWRLVNSGKLKTIGIGSRKLITVESIKALVEASQRAEAA